MAKALGLAFFPNARRTEWIGNIMASPRTRYPSNADDLLPRHLVNPPPPTTLALFEYSRVTSQPMTNEAK